jgi:hypothetical protein
MAALPKKEIHKMSKKWYTRTKRWASICTIAVALLLIMATAHAGSNTKSQKIRLGDPIKQMNIARDPNGSSITATIPAKSIDDYLKSQGLSETTITVQTIEEWVTAPDGSSHRRLTFIFGPSGCYFTDPFELQLKKDYISADCWLFDEKGEAVEATSKGNGSMLTFYIPHFSKYSYDQYY